MPNFINLLALSLIVITWFGTCSHWKGYLRSFHTLKTLIKTLSIFSRFESFHCLHFFRSASFISNFASIEAKISHTNRDFQKHVDEATKL